MGQPGAAGGQGHGTAPSYPCSFRGRCSSPRPLRWPRSACRRRRRHRRRRSSGAPRPRGPRLRPPCVRRPLRARCPGPSTEGHCTVWPRWPVRRGCGASTRAARPCSSGTATPSPPTSCRTPSSASSSPPLATASQVSGARGRASGAGGAGVGAVVPDPGATEPPGVGMSVPSTRGVGTDPPCGFVQVTSVARAPGSIPGAPAWPPLCPRLACG